MSKQDEEFLERLCATFKVEAEEYLQAMASALLELEKQLPDDQTAGHVESIFRHAHSLKGASRAVNLTEVESICQSLESFFAAWKRCDIVPRAEDFDTLHRALDLIGKVIPAADGKPSGVHHNELLALTRLLDNLGTDPWPAAVPAVRPAPVPEPVRNLAETLARKSPPPPVAAVPSAPPAPRGAAAKAASAQTVRIATAKLDKLLLEAEEMLAVKLATAQRVDDLRKLQGGFERWKKEWQKIQPMVRNLTRQATPLPATSHATMPGAATGRGLDALIEFLEWNSSYVKSLEGKLAALTKAAARDQHAVGRLVDDLLTDSKQLLMLPSSTVLDLFPKLVRDLSREQGKETELVIRGGEVEMDKRILEEMKDALIHLVRNCIDHGIEKPEVRARQGKPPRAVITLAVARLDGNNVEIVASDDGAGINVAKVKEAGIKRGLISAADADHLDDQQALALVFQSELTTSPLITEISGRGLGLAIVQEKSEKLGGRVAVETRPNVGATFRIILPLTLATFRGVLVRAADRIFVIPMANVERVARVRHDEIKTVENRETIALDGRAVALARLDGVLGLPGTAKRLEASAFISVIILGSAHERVAFVVDEMLHEEEVLVKKLAKPLSRVRNISGATILASGKVAPILNVPDLLKSARRASLAPPATADVAEVKAEGKRRRILVAEDSITSRMLLKAILESAGHEVKTAVDGVEALTELRTNDFDLVVSDIEMPRMNGFDLITHIRSDRKLANKPVILVTALASREDRERGIDVGANAYIVKSSFDQSNLLDAVHRLV